MRIKLNAVIMLLGLIIITSACSNRNSTTNTTDYSRSTTAIENTEATEATVSSMEIEIENSSSISSITPYSQSITEDDLLDAKAIAEKYYENSAYNGIVSISIAADDSPQYDSSFIKGKYSVGNIIIFDVLTQKDVDNGNPQRQTTVARSSEESSWEVITEGF